MKRALSLSTVLVASILLLTLINAQPVIDAQSGPSISITKRFVQSGSVFVVTIADDTRTGNDDSLVPLPFSDSHINRVKVEITNFNRDVTATMRAAEVGPTSNIYILAVTVKEQEEAVAIEGYEMIPGFGGDTLIVNYPNILVPISGSIILVDNTTPTVDALEPKQGAILSPGNATFSANITDTGSGFVREESEIREQSATHGIIKFTVLNITI